CGFGKRSQVVNNPAFKPSVTLCVKQRTDTIGHYRVTTNAAAGPDDRASVVKSRFQNVVATTDRHRRVLCDLHAASAADPAGCPEIGIADSKRRVARQLTSVLSEVAQRETGLV